MSAIRERLVSGDSHDTIAQQLGLNKRTYYRILRRVFEDDKKILQQTNQEELMRQLVILQDRYNDIYKQLREIAQDSSQSGEDRLHALHGAASLASTICKLHRDSPLVTIVESKKLKELKEGKGPLYFGDDSLFLPSVYRAQMRPSPSSQPPFSSLSPFLPPLPEEQEQESEPEEKEEERFDHE